MAFFFAALNGFALDGFFDTSWEKLDVGTCIAIDVGSDLYYGKVVDLYYDKVVHPV